jgi:hypothetical protein
MLGAMSREISATPFSQEMLVSPPMPRNEPDPFPRMQ